MNIIEIEIPKDTIALESSRSPENMTYEDFIWCIGVVFAFKNSSLRVEASLFGFTRKIVEALRQEVGIREPVLLNDENGAYQINLSLSCGCVELIDLFGNGSAELSLKSLLICLLYTSPSPRD